MDLLEKRVKSRFTNNIVYLPHPKTFAQYVRVLQDALLPAEPIVGGKSNLYRTSVAVREPFV